MTGTSSTTRVVESLAAAGATFPELAPVRQLIAAAWQPERHGDLPRWLDALAQLPQAGLVALDIGDCVRLSGTLAEDEQVRLHRALQDLHPWRKGPFELFGIHIDSEWRSDFKWRRLAPHLDVRGHRVLDVGSGNGYFGWQLLGAGARAVLGVDPTLLFCVQHQAVNHFARKAEHAVVPLRFEDLPAAGFDTVLSMGVLYHRRDPEDHVRALYAHTRPGGQLVLESLVVDAPGGLRPNGRYARMRNVHLVPSIEQITRWLTNAGFQNVTVLDQSATRITEQRTTAWMRFESLVEALDPRNPDQTIEGHPGPLRAMLLARRP